MAGAPMKASTKVYSVWALPPDDVRDRLKRLVSPLRSEFGDPAFEPHITVVGSIGLAPDDALRRFGSTCAALSPYLDPFSEINFEVSALALSKTDTEDQSLESWEVVELCHLSNGK
ncbi:cyclic phosphodiesterase-like [Musa acuminata AAA Group]|uniref:cyclic phosphodiesterase-like n=1 Tax=Musa acuminata AAA Group TaxID=214697 RepID=UPI0031D7F057